MLMILNVSTMFTWIMSTLSNRKNKFIMFYKKQLYVFIILQKDKRKKSAILPLKTYCNLICPCAFN